MKYFNLKSTFVALLTLVTSAVSFAQTVSIAHVNSQEIVDNFQEYKDAKKNFAETTKSYEKEVEGMVEELQKTVKQYQSEAASKTPEENQRRGEEIQRKEQMINKYRMNIMQELKLKEIQTVKPILEKVQNTISKIARENNISYVLDATTGLGVLVANGRDITPLVKKELGIVTQ